jgi:hypothetical protein
MKYMLHAGFKPILKIFSLPFCVSKKMYFCSGEMAERSNAAVLKTVVPQGTGGSNPSLSAKSKKPRENGAFFLTRTKYTADCFLKKAQIGTAGWLDT